MGGVPATMTGDQAAEWEPTTNPARAEYTMTRREMLIEAAAFSIIWFGLFATIFVALVSR